MKLSGKEQHIVLATLHLAKINEEHKCVPDWALFDHKFSLTQDEMRAIRDIIQDPTSIQLSCYAVFLRKNGKWIRE